MPAVASNKPAETQGAVINMSARGLSMSKIAKSLSIDRETVKRILAGYSQTPQHATGRAQRLVPVAYDTLEQGLKSDPSLALRFLEVTDLAKGAGDSYHIHGDVSLVSAVGMVPGSNTPLPTTGASTSSTPSLPATTSTATEAPAKNRLDSVGVSCHENFSQIADSTLVAELERRGFRVVAKPIEATDAEVIESNG